MQRHFKEVGCWLFVVVVVAAVNNLLLRSLFFGGGPLYRSLCLVSYSEPAGSEHETEQAKKVQKKALKE